MRLKQLVDPRGLLPNIYSPEVLLMTAIPYWNRRPGCEDSLREDALADDFLWVRRAWSSANYYPSFVADGERMLAASISIPRRELANLDGPDQLIDFLVGREQKLAKALHCALSERNVRAIPRSEVRLFAEYEPCEQGGGI